MGRPGCCWPQAYRDSQAGLRWEPRTCPPVRRPEAGRRESLNWVSRRGERDRGAQVRALRAGDAGVGALVESRQPGQPSRSLPAAGSCLDGPGERASLRGAAAGVRGRPRCPPPGALGFAGWQGGTGEVCGGGGGEGCWCSPPSQPVQDTWLPEMMRGGGPPNPPPLPSSLPHPPPKTTNLSSSK